MKTMAEKMKSFKSSKEKPMKMAEGSPSEEATESKKEEASEPQAESKKYDEHELQHMADTVAKAHEHMADPHVMTQLKPYLEKKTNALHSLKSLRSLRKAKAMASSGSGSY